MELKRFDYKLKESKKKPILIALIIVIVLLIGVTIYFTYAEYKVNNTYNILQGDIDFFEKRDLTIAVKLVDEEGNITYVEEIPEEGYVFDSEKSYCINGATIIYVNGKAEVAGLTGKEKCTMYFNELGALTKAIIANSTIVENAPDFSTTATEENTNLYKTVDDLGESYYFRGASTNNYVKFGTYDKATTLTVFDTDNWFNKTVNIAAGTPMYWRIIRINGDGTIRMIYDGTEKVANGTAHTATIGSTAYNTNYDEAKYVGYTYNDGTDTQVDSTIKRVVDTWYENNLEATYGKYIADNIFCNDREIHDYVYYKTGFEIVINPTQATGAYTQYGPYGRVENKKSPKLACTNKSDRYTTSDKIGNGLLKNPIGLITLDEVAMAGGVNSEANSAYYLYSYEYYYTLSPRNYDSEFVHGYQVDSSGAWNSTVVHNGSLNARPVINLKGNVKFTGNGTLETPYEIVTE